MRGHRIRAFTLLECLIALLVLSGSILVINGLTNLLHQQLMSVQVEQTKDWQIFCEQMYAELDGASFDKVEGNFLYVTKNAKKIRFGLMGDDFRKTSAQGIGYQPMLFGIKDVKIEQEQGLIKMTILFEKEGGRTFVYRFININ